MPIPGYDAWLTTPPDEPEGDEGLASDFAEDFDPANGMPDWDDSELEGRELSLVERPVYVTLGCNSEQIDENKVEFLDIAEGPAGEDILKFKCPRCGEVHESARVG